ncbi:MAG: isoprenylcysteine carboxylmethyltransferase family protein [Saprospiraceae bacterium]|jgi:protein-S-isoprenylcysteine O-methyltransferase Ste14|nr:isoprenylcysteine carboxylmethyltransferase family protein [Saprospiraceae bacterium]
MTVLHFTLATVAYYLLHSLLAADGVKAGLSRLLPARYYRLAYNVLAVLLLAALLILYFMVEKKPLWPLNKLLIFGGGILCIFGVNWVVQAFSKYDIGEFTGMEQLRSGKQPVHTKLIVRGMNGRVRHPLYFGSLLLVWGVMFLFQNDAAFAFAMVSTIYLIIGTRLEEEKLVAQFGKAYQKYQREVPMLVPKWRRG